MSTPDIILRGYLLAGLVAHKLLWEVMKRTRGSSGPKNRAATPKNLALSVVKLGKIAVLLGLFAQLFLPPILPIMSNAQTLRVAGIIIFTLGLLIAVLARLALGRNWSDIEVAEVQSEHRLVNHGVYQYVRHPIYTGDLAMLAGFELCLNSWLVWGVAAIAIPTVLGAVREEKALAKSVAGYAMYCQQTKRFIPFVI